MHLEEKLYSLILAHCGGKMEVTAETRLKKDLKMDSFDLLELVLKVEDHFDCRLSDELLRGVTTAGHLTLVLENAIIEKERKTHERKL